MEQQFEVKPVGVKYVCDSCGKGDMVYRGGNGDMILLGKDIKFKHYCYTCKCEKVFCKKYPFVDYVVIDN